MDKPFRNQIEDILNNWMQPSKEDKYISDLAKIIELWHKNNIKEKYMNKEDVRKILEELKIFADTHCEFLTEERINKALKSLDKKEG